MTPKKWPSHLPPKRAFQRQKRREYEEAMRTLGALRLGCAFLPQTEDGFGVGAVFQKMEEIGKVCRPWWRRA